MDGMMYYGALAIVVLIAIYFFRGGHILLSFLTLGVGAWLVYSHEEGVKLVDVREDIVKKIDESTKSEYKSVYRQASERDAVPEQQVAKTDESPQTDETKSEVKQADVKQTQDYAVEKSAPAEEKPKRQESRVYDYGSGYDR